MERNQIIGFILIFATLLGWSILTKPSDQELARAKRVRDSIAMTKQVVDTFTAAAPFVEATMATAVDSNVIQNQIVTLENEFLKLEIDSKGAKIVGATLKKHIRSDIKKDGENIKLLSNKANKFDVLLSSVPGGNTGNVTFTLAKSNNNQVIFTTNQSNGKPLQISYSLVGDYSVDYAINTGGSVSEAPSIKWIDIVPKLERSDLYEQRYSTVYFKEAEENPDYCSCTANDNEKLDNKPLDWISHSNQFFNSSLIARDFKFQGGEFTTELTDLKTSDDIKVLTSELMLPKDKSSYAMSFYIGPNEFSRLKAFDNGLEQVIPFGSSIFGTINRYVVRPSFDFLSSLISSKGLVIILLIFIIKMLLYPLLYKMLHGQAKMAALKPELDKLKAKNGDDAQKTQMDSMKMYQEYGVSPLSGCMPMLLQMPIWIALYRFFPASITFRRESFLWANDLSSYDDFFKLGFELPFMGSHLSLFTILWALSTLAYTYYSTKDVDMSANPAMKYVQYLMPIMFLGFFNSYASGLTAYMFFSNLINILQIVLTKTFVFDKDKIRAELEVQKAKPKKTSGFQAKLQDALAKQQQITEQRKKK